MLLSSPCLHRIAGQRSCRGFCRREPEEKRRKAKNHNGSLRTCVSCPQDLSQQQVDALVEQYKGVISANGGSVGRVENWGLKSLTYRVNKNRKAYYTLMDLTCPPAALNEMERQMGLSEDVLRFLTIKVEAHEEGPSAMMQKREERSERGGFGDRDRGDRDRARLATVIVATAAIVRRAHSATPVPIVVPRRPREGFEGGAE